MNSINQKAQPLKSLVIAWTPDSSKVVVARVDRDPGREYKCTAGGVYSFVHDMDNPKKIHAYLLDLALYLVFEDGVDPKALGPELKKIVEWNDALNQLAKGLL